MGLAKRANQFYLFVFKKIAADLGTSAVFKFGKCYRKIIG